MKIERTIVFVVYLFILMTSAFFSLMPSSIQSVIGKFTKIRIYEALILMPSLLTPDLHEPSHFIIKNKTYKTRNVSLLPLLHKMKKQLG